jgi:hypothetical protein
MVSDAPAPIQWYNGAVGAGPIIDTTGYQSIVVQFSGANGTYLFQTANDPGQFTAALANTGGWSALGLAAPVSSIAAATGLVYVIPVTGKFFRLYCSVAGTAGMITLNQRSAPAAFIPLTPTVSASISNTPAVTMTSTQALGNIAAGSGVSGNPVSVSGADQAGNTRRFLTDTNGFMSAIGPLRAGWQFGSYNAQFGGYTQVIASQTAALSTFAPVLMGGLDGGNVARFLQTDNLGRLITAEEQADNATMSNSEIFTQLLATNRTIVHLLSQLVAVSRGLPDPLVSDEPDALIAEYMDRRSAFTTLAN